MRQKMFLLTLLSVSILTATSVAQKNNQMNQYKQKLGIKGGYNYSRIAGSTPSFKPDSKNGFMVAAFYSAGGGTGMGYRTELVYSRKGLSYYYNCNKKKVQQEQSYWKTLTY